VKEKETKTVFIDRALCDYDTEQITMEARDHCLTSFVRFPTLRQWSESLLASRDMMTPVEQFSFLLCDVRKKNTRESAAVSGAVCDVFLVAWEDWYKDSFKAYISNTYI